VGRAGRAIAGVMDRDPAGMGQVGTMVPGQASVGMAAVRLISIVAHGDTAATTSGIQNEHTRLAAKDCERRVSKNGCATLRQNPLKLF
jgi:hypothetical protein